VQQQRYVFESPDRFVVGTIGQPGEREFYLQASNSGQIVTVGLEKGEVSALAEGLVVLLGEVRKSRTDLPEPGPAQTLVDRAPLDLPFHEDFHLGQLTVSWDGQRVSVEAAGVAPGTPEPPEDEEELDSLSVSLSVEQTYAFVERARNVVSAGLPPCVLCGRPDGPDGHVCPRLN
jgi:uncharacterized repeat protein (TIGR03847 family)